MKKWKNLIAGLIVLALLMTGCSSVGQTAGNGPEAGSEAAAGNEQGTGQQSAGNGPAAGSETAAGNEQGTGQQSAEDGQTADGVQAVKNGEKTDGRLNVHYLDVGQGNAVLLESQGHYMLIDGGNRKASSFVVSYLKRQNIEALDYILISHFDEDHLAGTIGALYQFPAGKVITADYETDSSIYKSYQQAMDKQGYEETHPSQGDVFSLGSASVRVISPVSYGHQDENEDSVGVIVENGENRFFFGGDMGKTGEKEAMESGVDIAADVFLLNHHGSYLSSGFLERVSPSYAVISCGDGNSYGHPRQDTMGLLEEAGIPVFRTDKQGTVILHSDGKTISWEQEPCNDYTPGTRTASGDKEEPYVEENNSDAENCDYVLNTHTKKIHLPSCSSLKGMKEENKAYYKGSKDELTDNGYEACGNCKP